MKYLAAFFGLVIALASLPARAQSSSDDQYVSIYTLIEQADALQTAGQPRQALQEYRQAADQLEKFSKIFPDWNPTIVNFRLNYLTQKINDLTAQTPAATTNAPATTAAATAPATDIDSLRAQLQRLQSENATLQAKLREALSAQPAAADTQELAMAQQQVQSLLKENEVLRATVEQQKNAAPAASGKDVKELQMALNETKQKLDEQTSRADKLAKDNQSLQARLQSVKQAPQALRDENAMLKKQVAMLETMTNSNAGAELVKLRAQVEVLQSDDNVQYLEKMALEKKLQQLQSSSAETSASTNDDMSAEHFASQMEAATNPPDVQPMTINADTNAAAQLPDGSAGLVAEAQNYFSAHEYDKAEADYQKILQSDPNNGAALANLAAIEMEEGKLSDAEKHINTALAQTPNDPYDLSIDGYLKFRQQKYDDALDVLTRAAKLDPKNPQIQNYLGVTLSHKGQQAEAEQALLKAVELDPDYAAAHNNLAVVYINENPPKVGLARWHYQKALDAGQPRNADLEKLLAEKGAPVAEQ